MFGASHVTPAYMPHDNGAVYGQMPPATIWTVNAGVWLISVLTTGRVFELSRRHQTGRRPYRRLAEPLDRGLRPEVGVRRIVHAQRRRGEPDDQSATVLTNIPFAAPAAFFAVLKM